MTSHSPKDLVFTLFGDYLLHRPEPVWVGSIIRLLEPLELSEGAVRTVLSRMARKGWFETHKSGRLSYYELSHRGRQLLDAGEERIYHPRLDQPWDGRWSLIAYSIPEDQRHLRNQLRVRLAWLGFGSLGNGLWISPHDAESEVNEIASALGIAENLECFRGERSGAGDAKDLVARCWDLPGINSRYEEFISQHVPSFKRFREQASSGGISAQEAYVYRFRLVHEYREFPLVDPYLPGSLLPRDWAGECATQLFQTLHDLLTEPADRYVGSILEEAPVYPGTEAALSRE